MHKFLATLLTVSLIIVAQGCGNTNPSDGSQAASPADGDTGAISQVAGNFLTALRTGNSNTANAQLTPLAQQRMREADMDFGLLANEAASFQLGKVALLDVDQAGIDVVWMEPDSAGKLQKEQWTIALQKIENSWRVLGILAETDPSQPPMVMDFENPGQAASPANTAATPQPANVPQQATRPTAQDPFRQ